MIDILQRATQFLALEAMLLDEGRFEEWLQMLDDQLTYEVRLQEAGFRIKDTKPMIAVRIERLRTSNAHAEVPPSRTVRSVCSICVLPSPDQDVVNISSTLIVYRQRGIDSAADVIHARRNDRLHICAGTPRLAARSVILAENSLTTPNLAIFL